MMILAIDTSSAMLSLALGRAEPQSESAIKPVLILGERDILLPRGTMSEMMPAIDGLLKETGCSIHDIEVVVVGTGPGSYTGLRIGVVMARTLAQMLDAQILGLPSADALALQCSKDDVKLICPVIDAKRGEVYNALYCSGDVIPKQLNPLSVTKPDVLAQELLIEEYESITFVGDGVDLYRDVLAGILGDAAAFAPSEQAIPKAASLMAAAMPKISKAVYDDINKLTPIYVRVSQAEEMWAKRHGGAC